MERMYDIRKKEVINIFDGTRLGFVSDVILDETNGRIKKLIVPAPAKLLGLYSGGKEYKIGWDDIKVVGDDFLVIDADPNSLLSN
ncbi:MAG: YlmC/YmxH family sporulation protein [Eubacterium sp.]|nr:YlmC/YmxH family sporulation protein [Eubacterium sp.]